MGAAVSTVHQQTEKSLIDESYTKCGKVAAQNYVKINNLKFKPAPGCGVSTFQISQEANVDAKCVINALQENASNLMSKLKAGTQTGIGLSVSTTVDKNKEEIKRVIKNECPDTMASNTADLNNFNVEACHFLVPQVANAQQGCEVKMGQKIISELSKEIGAESTGFFGSSKSLFIILLILIILGALSGVGYYFYNKKKTGGGTSDTASQIGGCINYAKQNTSCWILIILIIIIAIIFYFFPKNKKSNSIENNLTKYKNDLMAYEKKIFGTNQNPKKQQSQPNLVQNPQPNLVQNPQPNPVQNPQPNPVQKPQPFDYNKKEIQQPIQSPEMTSDGQNKPIDQFYKTPLEDLTNNQLQPISSKDLIRNHSYNQNSADITNNHPYQINDINATPQYRGCF